MPHIHTAPNQHDMTVSAYVIRREAGGWKCLVHMHKKIDMLMQIGGHIELNQTPWQAFASEITDESGYVLSDLQILQPLSEVPNITDAVVHPAPFLVNTHDVGGGHYHSDLCYALVASVNPSNSVSDDESDDLRWYNIDELREQAKDGTALQDTVDIYSFLLRNLSAYTQVPASSYSLDKPIKGISYKR